MPAPADSLDATDRPAEPARSRSLHVPVLLRETIRGLELSPGLTVVDGTAGGGGHAAAIWEQIRPSGTLIGVDRDPMMLELAQAKLPDPAVHWHLGSYLSLPDALAAIGRTTADRILVDLGLSSDQLNDRERGFSFQTEGPLDLRFDPRSGLSASDMIRSLDEAALTRLLRDLGEEPRAAEYAHRMLSASRAGRLKTARDLAELIAGPQGVSPNSHRHPATQVFQALRLAVNSELEHVRQAVTDVFPQCLAPGGLLAVITFHSLEDRIVKDAFRDSATWTNLTPKPLEATPAEVRFNPRSRSAKLRLARRR